jgi:chemotaxis protein methyltransferase CheR
MNTLFVENSKPKVSQEDADEILQIEVDLLLEALFRRYGYDFRNYSRPSVERRLAQFISDKNYQSYTDMIARLLRDYAAFSELLPYFSVSVTALFRDPFFYIALRDKVLPMLKTWPHFKVWHAGCATGEEPYSMAIILAEQNLLDRAMLYATDISISALEVARAGVYSLEIVKQGSANFRQYSELSSLSEYFKHTVTMTAFVVAIKKAKKPLSTHQYFFSFA